MVGVSGGVALGLVLAASVDISLARSILLMRSLTHTLSFVTPVLLF